MVISLIGTITMVSLFWFYTIKISVPPSASEHEPGFEEIALDGILGEPYIHPRLRGLDDWKRPEGPWRVALQVGHWKASEAPDELENLRVSTGTSYGSATEWELSLAIAEQTKQMLEASGVIVEILPTTIPPNYFSDVFVSIHADGNTSSLVSGYKVAAPRWDYSGQAEAFTAVLDAEYQNATKLRLDPNVTRTMRGYYAFNWRKYEHSLHPLTVAAIVETGFLTNANDRRIIVNFPEKPARGIADGILKFLDVTPNSVPDIEMGTEK